MNLFKAAGLTSTHYKVIRSDKRITLSMTVYPDNRVIIKAPHSLPENQIRDFVSKKRNWLKKRLEFNTCVRKTYIPKKFIQGEDFLFLGRKLNLYIYENNGGKNEKGINLAENCIKLKVPSGVSNKPLYIAEKLSQWYKRKALNIFSKRLNLYGETLKVKVKDFKVRKLSKTWGNCSAEGVISLNWKLVMAPIAVIDYVIVHELCHLIHLNHSKAFWKTLENVIPGHKTLRKWLVIHENYLKF